MRTPSTAGIGLALVSAASFGTSGSFARSLTDDGWSAAAAVAARIGVAAAVLAIPALLALRGRWFLIGRNLGPLTMYGLVAVAGVQVCFFYAIQRVSVGVALLLEYLGILLVVAWMWAVRGQRPRQYTIAGAALSVAGLILVLDLAGDTRIDPIGVLYGLGAAVGLGARLASFVGLTEVLFAVLIAWFLLDELPTVIQLAGGALILTGVALVRIDDLRIADSDRNYVREAGHAQQVDEIRARIHHPDSTAMPSSGEL